MSQKMSTRQSRQHTVLPMIGNSADETLDSVLSKIDAQHSKLFEDRNALLVGGGFVTVNATSTAVSFTAALSLILNSKVAGGAPVNISLGSTTRAFTTDGNMLYAVIDRIAGTATVTADATTLPAVTSANQEVYLIAKRVGSNIYFRGGQSLQNGITTPLGRTSSTLDSEFSVVDGSDATKKLTIDVAGTTGTTTIIATSQTTNRTVTLPDATDTLVGKATTDTLSNKTLQFLSETVATDSATTGTNVTLGAFTTGIVRLTNASLISLSGIPAGAAGQSLTIENVTGNSFVLNNDEATATAANRIYTGTAANVTIKSQSSVLLKYDVTTARWMLVGGTGSGSGGGAVNLILNPDGEAGTTGWLTYADAAGTRPIDGVGGSPTVTWNTTNNTPLIGNNSFTFTKGASNTQGQGVAYQFTVDQAYRAKALTISMDYIIRAGTFVAGVSGPSGTDSDMIVYLYDVTNSQLIEPSNFKFFSNSSTISDKFTASFQTSVTGTTYRLILHCASISSAAYTLGFDNISVSPNNFVYATPITDWLAYTPTITGVGTPTSVQFYWRRIGDSIQVKGVYTTGTVTAAALSFTLPNGLTADPNKYGGVIGDYPGWAVRNNATASARKRFSLQAVSGQNIIYYGNDDYTLAGSPGSTIAGNTALANTEQQSLFLANVPITGWSSSVQTSDQTDTRVVVFSGINTGSQAVTSGSTNINFTSRRDTHGGWTGSTYIIPVAGDYLMGACVYSTSGTVQMDAYVNGVNKGYLGFSPANTAGSGSIILPNLKVGDVVSLRALNTLTIASDADQNLSITRISGPSAIAATESYNMRYSSTAGQSLTSGVNTLQFPTKSFDSHGSFTSNTTFTAQISGKFAVSLKIATNTLNGTSTNLISILVNGSIVSQESYAQGYITGANYSFRVIDDLDLKAGDTVTFQFQNGFGSTITMSTNVGQNVVSIKRVGN